MGMFDNWMGGKPNPQGSSSDGSGGSNGQNGSGSNNAGTNGQNNGGADALMIDNIWAEPETKRTDTNPNTGNGSQGGNGNGGNNPGNNGAQLTPEQQVNNFLTAQGLGQFQLSDQEKEALKNGDFDGVLGKLNQRIQQAYIKSMEGMNALVNKKVQDAVDKAVGASKEYVEGKELRALIQDRLPFAKDPALQPVAEAVFKQFMLKPGANREKALDATKRYFERTAELVQGSVNKNTGGTYRGDNSTASGDMDWMAALTGKAA